MKMSDWPLEQFEENGFAVVEDFLTPDEVAELREAGRHLYKYAPKSARKIFFPSDDDSSEVHHNDEYFLESGNKVHYFFESNALDADGNLIVDSEIALNKVGHALHIEHPTFKKITCNERVRKIAAVLGFRKPVIPQSMFIFKNPGIGSEVNCHQDATYTYTVPESLIGFWIPLEDASLENGCLRFAVGSHKNGLKRRLIRNLNKTSGDLLIYDRPHDSSTEYDMIPCPVKKGTLVLIHGLVVHSSDANLSSKSRPAYTFHLMETNNTDYSKENWLQYPEGESFSAV